jgi:hypothetical protein
MEIQTLKLFLTEDEVNDLVRRFAPDTGSIENLRIRLTPEGVLVQGEYPTMVLRVRFETLWEPRGEGPEVVARLASVRVSGIPAKLLRGALLKVIRDLVGQEIGVRVADDGVRVHLEEIARAHGLPLRINVTAVRCSIATMVLEAGRAG